MGILERIIKGDTAVTSFKRQLRNVLGFTPGKAVLYRTALTHRSVKDGADENNERLEYLGDAILSAIIADFLFKKYPYKEEGFLTEMRSKMVNRNQLNEIAIKMGLKKISNFNKFDSSLKMSQIFGNTLEAIVGAIYLDKGFEKTRQWVMERVIQPYLFLDDLENLEINHKNKLYGWANRNGKNLEFETLRLTVSSQVANLFFRLLQTARFQTSRPGAKTNLSSKFIERSFAHTRSFSTKQSTMGSG